jgi:uncharacterized paraquat-inducible protein A
MCKRFLLCVLTVLVTQGCSSKQVYQALQENQRQRCQQELIPSAYRECIAQEQTSYEDYEKERRALNEPY